MAEVAAVLLAAGESARFGPENKLIAELNGRALVRTVAEALLGVPIAKIMVVTGYDAAPIERALQGLPARFVHNGRWRNGMGSSIAAGVTALSQAADAAFIVPGDMPLLTTGLLRSLIAAFERLDGASVVYPATPEGEQRNPVLWPKQHFPLLIELQGREGAKTLLKRSANSCAAVVVADESVFRDVDTPDDLAVARAGVARLGNGLDGARE